MCSIERVWAFVFWIGAMSGLPAVDPVNGSTLTEAERDLLPSGQSAANVADLWLVSPVSLRPVGAGIARFDRPAISAHGWSWIQQRFALNSLDITDPARPGTPLIEVPHALWQQIHYASRWTDRPEWGWTVSTHGQPSRARAELGYGLPVGGGTWVPEGWMDREPALAWGADPSRRSVLKARQVVVDAQLDVARVAVEHVGHEQQFPTLRRTDGQLWPERAERTTVLLGGQLPLVAHSVRLLALWQGQSRSHDGAALRYPAPWTAEQSGDGLLAQLDTDFYEAPDLRVRGALGFGWRHTDWESRSQSPLVSDLEAQWTWMGQFQPGEQLERSRVDWVLDGLLGPDEAHRLRLRGGFQQLASTVAYPGGIVATRFAQARQSQNRSVALCPIDSSPTAREWLHQLRLELRSPFALGKVAMEAVAALDEAAVGSRIGPSLWYVSPALGLSARYPFDLGDLFALARREPLSLTAEVSSFLDPDRPAGNWYQWHDDGDGVPEPQEAGGLLSRWGGAYNRVAPGLVRPTSNLVAFGWRSPRWGLLAVTVTGTARALLDHYTVVLSGPAAASYQRTTVAAVAGTDPAAAGVRSTDLDLPVYVRTPGTEGDEQYELTNARRPSYFVGSEIQLRVDNGSWWFVNLAAAGYWSLGTAPFGLFAERNDTGIVTIDTGDPNHRINQWGSLDNGRAYHINLLTGARGADGWSGALVLRYVDGEPMTRFVVVEDLPQGPTALMAQPRGNPIPRYTFHLTIDLKARYERPVGPLVLAGTIELYNLLGSGTEILEEVGTSGQYRRSLEMMPGRAVLIGMAARWQ